jgi:hypothetical protein
MPDVAIALEDFDTTGELSYIGKHNANNAALRSAIGSILRRLTGSAGAPISIGDALASLLGDTAAVIGDPTGYECSGAGVTLTIQPGYAWSPAAGVVTALGSAATSDFTGLANGTYYLSAAGGPTVNGSSTDALYSIGWDGSAFGTITRLATLIDDLPTLTAAAAKATDTFVTGDLTSDELEIVHALDTLTPTIVLVDNTDVIRLDVPVTVDDADTVTLDFTGLTPLTGTWRYCVKV